MTDLRSMSDQELLDRMTEIHKRIGIAARCSSDGYLMDQLRNMANACAFEQQERAQTRIFELLNKNRPDEIDLSEMKPAMLKTNGKNSTTSAKRDMGNFRTTRTSKPVKE